MTYVNNVYFDAPLIQPVITERGVFCYRLAADWKVKLNPHEYVIIPEGSLSNFASIPWFFRWVVQSSDPVIALPSIIHDYLVAEWYYTGGARKPPIRYSYKDDGVESEIQGLPLYDTEDGFNWVESAKLFRMYALSFRGRTAHVKARVCYVMIRLFGYYRDLVK